jgi:hypothetical protein
VLIFKIGNNLFFNHCFVQHPAIKLAENLTIGSHKSTAAYICLSQAGPHRD